MTEVWKVMHFGFACGPLQRALRSVGIGPVSDYVA